jgi:hypothetical protein
MYIYMQVKWRNVSEAIVQIRMAYVGYWVV